MTESLAPFVPIAAASVSALVAALVAWITTRRTLRAEVERLRLAVQQKLLEQLVAARLAVYPELYAMLSELPKAARGTLSSPGVLRELLAKVNAWDSKHAILLGPDATNVCYAFRQTLADAGRGADEVDDTRLADLFRRAELLELALRSDLGIYGVELAQAPAALRTPFVDRY